MHEMNRGWAHWRRWAGSIICGLVLLVGLGACGGDDDPDISTVELQLTNNTNSDNLSVYVAAEGIGERTWELNPIGPYETWSKADYPLVEGLVLEIRVFFTNTGEDVAAGSCTVSDAQALNYARVEFSPEVVCSCGFEGTTGCEPGN